MAVRTRIDCIVAMASGPSATPVRGIDITADQDQVGLLARRQQLRDRQAVGDNLNPPADQCPGNLERRRAAVQENGVAVLEQRRGRQTDGTLFGGRRLGAFVKRRHRPHLAGVNRPAMSALDRPGQIKRFQIAPDRALGNAQNLHQLVQGRIALPSDQIQKMSATSLGEHAHP